MTYTAKITVDGKTSHAWQFESKTYSNARLTAQSEKNQKGLKGFLTVTSAKQDKEKSMFPFTVEIYKLDQRGNEMYSDVNLKTGERILDMITLRSFSSVEEALKEAQKNTPTKGCFGFKIVVLENEEEVYCKSYKF